MRTRLWRLLAALTIALPAGLEAQYFGQNKVVYGRFEFEVIRTEHFDLYFYGRERAAALDAARMAERAYARLSRILNHEWRDRKPLILYASQSDFVQTNAISGDIGEGTGGVTEFFKHRMVLPFTGSYADFEHVLQHEMVHAFQYDVFSRGHPGAGFTTLANVNPPLWFMEGMAEYLSLGPVDAPTAMWVRDAAVEGPFPSIERMTYDPRVFPYRFGHALFAYVGQKWGDETIGAVLQGAMAGGIERAFQRVLGLSLQELSDEWRGWCSTSAAPRGTTTCRRSCHPTARASCTCRSGTSSSSTCGWRTRKPAACCGAWCAPTSTPTTNRCGSCTPRAAGRPTAPRTCSRPSAAARTTSTSSTSRAAAWRASAPAWTA